MVGKIVLGKSLNYKGEPNPIMAEIEPFKAALEKETGLPVVYENETLTSAEARRPFEWRKKTAADIEQKENRRKKKNRRE